MRTTALHATTIQLQSELPPFANVCLTQRGGLRRSAFGTFQPKKRMYRIDRDGSSATLHGPWARETQDGVGYSVLASPQNGVSFWRVLKAAVLGVPWVQQEDSGIAFGGKSTKTNKPGGVLQCFCIAQKPWAFCCLRLGFRGSTEKKGGYPGWAWNLGQGPKV